MVHSTVRTIAFILLLGGCATHSMPERQRLHSELRWKNQTRELATSLWVSPFFRDDSRLLLSRDPPDETELLVTPDGQPISPGEALEVLPAGTPVRVTRVSFPTLGQKLLRPLMTPREQPWIELAVLGRSAVISYVIVLPPGLSTEEELTHKLERWLAQPGVATEVDGLGETDKQLIQSKRLVPGVSRRALELAFGPPRSRAVKGDGASVVEEWSWVSDLGQKRRAFLRDGIVERVETPSESQAP